VISTEALEGRIRILLWIFIFGLIISGVTAIPLETEAKLLRRITAAIDSAGAEHTGLVRWLTIVRDGLVETNAKYPFIAYGTDWLAFGHFVVTVNGSVLDIDISGCVAAGRLLVETR